MVLASNVQMMEPRPYDYAEYIVDDIHSCFVNFKDVDSLVLKNYSLLMHMILYYGKMKDMWPQGLKISMWETNKENKLVQFVWDYRYSASCYLCFEEFFVKPLYSLFGYQMFPSISSNIERFLRPRDNGLGEKIRHNWGDW